jgi:hypothetical protein
MIIQENNGINTRSTPRKFRNVAEAMMSNVPDKSVVSLISRLKWTMRRAMRGMVTSWVQVSLLFYSLWHRLTSVRILDNFIDD